MGGSERATAHKRLGGRATLTVRDPLIEQTLLAGNIPLDDPNIESVRRWSNALLKARNAWADENRHGRRYSDREAPRANSNGGRTHGY